MSMSTLRTALRPLLTMPRAANVVQKRVSQRMSTESVAQAQMKAFWEKNHALKRPLTHFTTYKMHQPMIMSLTHRITGIAMGVVLYGVVIGLYAMPGDFTHYLNMIKDLEISKALMFPLKMVVAFPLVYHYLNGIRHLSWDFGKGMKLATMYKSGYGILATSIVMSAFLASLAYF